MDAWHAIGWIFLAVLVGAVLLMIMIEARAWQAKRSDPTEARRATHRLLRRGAGASLLLLALILIVYPPTDALTTNQQLVKIMASLALCLPVFMIVRWDYRIMSREIRREVDGFMDQSTAAFRKHLEELAAKNPELADKLPEILSQHEPAASPPTAQKRASDDVAAPSE
jgi:TRAP-type C4-dicarboxylate transport system permease large subunit